MERASDQGLSTQIWVFVTVCEVVLNAVNDENGNSVTHADAWSLIGLEDGPATAPECEAG